MLVKVNIFLLSMLMLVVSKVKHESIIPAKTIVLENIKLNKIEMLLPRIIFVESSGNPNAISPKGAKGLMQLMPVIIRHYGVKDPFDPIENIKGGYQHLVYLDKVYKGDINLVLAAYNAGETRVNKLLKRYGNSYRHIQTRLPIETIHYISKITKEN